MRDNRKENHIGVTYLVVRACDCLRLNATKSYSSHRLSPIKNRRSDIYFKKSNSGTAFFAHVTLTKHISREQSCFFFFRVTTVLV